MATLLIALVVSDIFFSFFAAADPLHSFPGPDTSPDGLTLSDLSVEGPRELGQGDVLTFFFVLRNSPDNPSVTFTSKGMFVAAVDPEGNDRSFGFMYPGETLRPGQSLIFYGDFMPNVAGAWKFWPSYEIIAGELETKTGPQEWHVFDPTIEARDMPDLAPLSLSLRPAQPRVGEEVKISLTVKNMGSATSGECYGALFVEGRLETSVYIAPLDPGEITETALNWFFLEQGTWEIELLVDYWDAIHESDERNNFLELLAEITHAEETSLEIISDPEVFNVTPNSAVVEWETNELSDSRIEYGPIAGSYSLEKTDGLMTDAHSIMLTDLRPSTTYHYSVHSQDITGNTVHSGDRIFETLHVTDEIWPSISLIAPHSHQGIVEVSANAWDNLGVERTEFYLDDELVFTDYSPPYGFSVDTSAYENGVHMLTAVVSDLSGQSKAETMAIEIANVEDESAPKVDITLPKQDDKVSGNIQVTATLSDDVGLAQIFFKVDGQYEGFKGLPSHPKSTSVTFDWDTKHLENGRYRIAVEAYDKEVRYGFDVVDVLLTKPPTLNPPKLKVMGHTVTRQDNHFLISLTVGNVGDTDATEVVISDYLRSFQPISGSDPFAEYRACFTPSENMGDITIESKVVIPPTWSYTYTYEAVPVLFHGLYFVSDIGDSPAPSIGNPIRIWYEGQDGSQYYEEYELPVLKTSNGETIKTSFDNAVKSADYLILTDSHRLFYFNNDQDVNDLLSTMARLARYEDGVLGYSTYETALHQQAIRDLIEDGGEWSSKLKSGWSSNGYLLLVGETEIIPTWSKNLGTYETTIGPYTWNVLTDSPYANTYGEENKPELSIGRIIGNNAKELRKVIETSLNILLQKSGYEFDRSHALLVSGFSDEVMKNFQGQADAVSTVIGQETPNTILSKLNTPDYAQYDSTTGKMNEAFTEAAIEYIFFSSIKGKDIIFLAGHGNWDHWDKIHNSDVLGQTNPFGWTNPFVFASSCKTGEYFSGYGLAESFLQRGAAVYLGATESGGWTPYSKKFFEMWDLDEPVSLAVKQMKASLGNDLKDKLWSNIYHVYGDAKFGASNSLMKSVIYFSSAKSEAPSSIDVNVPDYEIIRIDGEDHVEIPGGFEFFEIGMPVVPSYKVFYSYPKGYQIQDVVLTQRSEPINLSGLNIPNASLTLPASYVQLLSHQSDGIEWWPENDFEWAVYQSPENSTLAITIYPLFYNPKTSEAKFYKNYSFYVNHTTSNVQITHMSTDKHVYDPGEPVKIDLELNNIEDLGKDVVINAIITHESTGEVAGGINLHTLKELKGKASYSTMWNNTDLEPGNYDIIVELSDTRGVLLDKTIENIRLGISSGEITGFDVKPESFQIGDNVTIKMIFNNTGNTDISGIASIKICDSEGYVIDEFEHRITELAPAKPTEFTDEWDTSEAEDRSYKIIGYVVYDGDSTFPVTANTYLTSFTVDNLSIQPGVVKIGESVVITVECGNSGASPGSHTVTLKVDGRVEDEETLALNPDEVTTVSFEVSADQEGTHAVEVDDLTGTFTVEKAQTGIPGFSHETTLFGLLIAIVLLMHARKR